MASLASILLSVLVAASVPAGVIVGLYRLSSDSAPVRRAARRD